jgi:hypothetical protein
VIEKLGADHQMVADLAELEFRYNPGFYIDGMTISQGEHRAAFLDDMGTAVGILQATREASAKSMQAATRGPTVNVHSHGGSATANASAHVSIEVSADQLRTMIATASELTPEEKGAAIVAVPDDDADLDLEKLDRLLSVATKSKELLKTVLGYVLGNPDRWPF